MTLESREAPLPEKDVNQSHELVQRSSNTQVNVSPAIGVYSRHENPTAELESKASAADASGDADYVPGESSAKNQNRNMTTNQARYQG